MPESPYRLAPATDLADAGPTSLLYPAVIEPARTRVARAGASVWLGATVAGPILFLTGHASLAGAACALVGGWTLARYRRSKKTAGVLFTVLGDVLTLTDGARPPLVIPLGELEDVGLDSKSIRKMELGNDPVPAVRFTSPRIGPEIDVARIVLSIAGRDEPFCLTDEFLPHMDAVEWAGKIRSFLRKHRWLPEDERDADDQD